MSDLLIGTIAFNTPWVIAEQIRLFAKNVRDDHQLIVFDNSNDREAVRDIGQICASTGTEYVRQIFPQSFHHYALNDAFNKINQRNSPYFGFVDHDLFPAKRMKLIPMIDKAGFITMGQTHSASGRRYPWPGFIIFQREWLADRPVNFFGYRARDLRDNGDTGSMNFGLFTDEDWQRLPALHHEYVAVREGHSAYLQDWGYERIGDFIHLTNASDWMEIQNPDERHALLRGVVESL